jgi:hypothetical protein
VLIFEDRYILADRHTASCFSSRIHDFFILSASPRYSVGESVTLEDSAMSSPARFLATFS